jgi:hypothetical protein
MTGKPANQVLDYDRMHRMTKPRRLHNTDCPHASSNTLWRPATSEELKQLRVCQDCAG